MTHRLTLNTAPAAMDLDAMYERLIAAHNGLTEAQSHALNARLVLLLANHIGQLDPLQQAFTLARESVVGAQAADSECAAITAVAPSHSAPV